MVFPIKRDRLLTYLVFIVGLLLAIAYVTMEINL